MTRSNEGNPGGKGAIFQLFVTGDEPHSMRAKENLRKFCTSYLNESFEIEVVDVIKSFKLALENKIFLTPALKRIAPEPAVTVFGDLRDTQELIRLLGSRGDE